MTPGKTESAGKIKPPEINTLGEWPSVEDAIRQMGRDRGVTPEEIETFLEEIKRRRSDESSDESFANDLRGASKSPTVVEKPDSPI